MSYGGWAPYVSVAERRRKAEKAAAKAKKSGEVLQPIEPYRGAIAKTFWGKAWCDNLESYSDYANRLPRGRTYARNGSVIHLKITPGEVKAQVMGSSLYRVSLKVTPVPPQQWAAIGKSCAGSIDSLVELLQGKLSAAVMQHICAPRTGLFPAPKEISLSCSCPDSAAMCKHVAAVLYGVGARLDTQPEWLFALRQVNAKDLVTQAGAGLTPLKKGPASSRVLDDALLDDVFGLEMDAPAEVPPQVLENPRSANKGADMKNVAVVKKAAEVKKVTLAKKGVPTRARKPTAKLATTNQTPTVRSKSATANLLEINQQIAVLQKEAEILIQAQAAQAIVKKPPARSKVATPVKKAVAIKKEPATRSTTSKPAANKYRSSR